MLTLLLFLASLDASRVEDTAKHPASARSLSAGVSQALVLSAYAAAASRTLDLELTGKLEGPLWFGGGGRFGPQLKDGYVHLTLAPTFDWYSPQAGLELGVSVRANIRNDPGLLSEFRGASLQDCSPIYFAVRVQPLGITLGQSWRLQFLGLHVGAYTFPLGRILRGNLQALSLEARW